MISKNTKIHKSVSFGEYCIVEDDVEIGEGTVVKNYVELRKGTRIGKNCYIDSRVSTSGDCTIGDNVTLRYDTIIARGVIVGRNSYICPRVMTNNLDTGKKQIGGANIGSDCFVGTNSVLQHGITIGNKSIIGSMSFVTKSIPEGEIWVGSPARYMKNI